MAAYKKNAMADLAMSRQLCVTATAAPYKNFATVTDLDNDNRDSSATQGQCR